MTKEQQEHWIKTYYPETARAVKERAAALHPGTTKEDKQARDRILLEHTKRKWQGLATIPGAVRYNLPISLGTGTCSLCQEYVHTPSPVPEYARCGGCPLFEQRGVPCDAGRPDIDGAPYAAYTVWSRAKPMLDLIDAALAATSNASNATDKPPSPYEQELRAAIRTHSKIIEAAKKTVDHHKTYRRLLKQRLAEQQAKP